ncbi:uncharacterized protein LOC141708410 isoform X1 [Apium graveolens]|uniref:uncharacterized protein LOC141708410 isoform X1 n=1 Tax=Apium graveolens TaxID=4045 RepID=UPI003D79FFBA
MTSTIILIWDDSRKSVVAKKEQDGIAQRHVSPYIDVVPSCHNILDDVVNVPQETFDLENLTDVLLYEVWKTHLSEKERNLLTQFLPKGTKAQHVFQELLEGDNFQFGNPLMRCFFSHSFADLQKPQVELDGKACAAVGQNGLMALHDTLFSHLDVTSSQLLVTNNDFKNADFRVQLGQTLNSLLALRSLPIFNENDAISTRKTPYKIQEQDQEWHTITCF